MATSGKLRLYLIKPLGLTMFLLSLNYIISNYFVGNNDNNNMKQTKTKSFWNVSDVSHRMLDIHDATILAQSLQRTAAEIIRQVIGPIRKGMVFDMGDFENKGDPALALGQLHLFHILEVEILFACGYSCSSVDMEKAVHMAAQYNRSELVIFTSGGGNMGGYPYNDGVRSNIIKKFLHNKMVILSQSTWFHTGDDHLKRVAKAFSEHPDLHILFRDRPSLEFAQVHFNSTKVYLAPDMAFGLGSIPRFFPPIYDVVWIRRRDDESPGDYKASFPSNVSFFIHDWFGNEWLSPRGDDLVDSLSLKTMNGLLFIQRGRVLVTDRLHGHILASLMDIPTVIIDNKIRKISSLRNVWTAGLKRVVVARDAEEAVQKALFFLQNDSNITPLASSVALW